MGPCPSNQSPFECLFSKSFNTWIWLQPDDILPSFGAEADTITISGFSGGSATSTNLQTIYSDTIKGAGLLNGGPYGDLFWNKPEHFNQPTDYAQQMARTSIQLAEKMQSQELIDNLENLKDAPVFILSGSIDDVYPPPY